MALALMPAMAFAEGETPVTSWDDLKSKVESATSDTTIHISGTLAKDTGDAAITIPDNVHITLVGDGATKIVRPSKSDVGEFIVGNGEGLTLQGAITVAGAETDGKAGDLAFANFIKVEAGGSLSLEGSLTAATSGATNSAGQCGLISCEGDASIEDGAALSGWTSSQSTGSFDDERAALVINGASANLAMNGGEVFGNQNLASSGTPSSSAIQIRNGASFTMTGGSIHDNVVGKKSSGTKGCGGGVLIAGTDSNFKMSGGSIANNSGRYGAGVYVEGGSAQDASFTMTGGSISENIMNSSSGSYGGGLYAQNAVVTIENPDGAASAPTFSGNTTSTFPGDMSSPFTGDGGAIYCSDVALTMNGAVVKDTKAESTNYHGGTIHLADTKADLKNSTVKDNQCGDVNMAFAGAFYIEGASDVTMDNMTITGNSAAPHSTYGNGGVGGILVVGETDAFAKLTISNSDISGNYTGGSESGALHAECTDLTITDTTINDNSVEYVPTSESKPGFSYYAGALYLAGSTVDLTRVTLDGNKCVDGLGGAIMMEDITDRSGNVISPCKVELTDCTLSGNQAPRKSDKLEGGMGGAVYVGSGTLTAKGQTSIADNSAYAGGGILVAPEGTAQLQDDTAISGNAADEGGNGDGVCVMSDATSDAAATNIGTFAIQDNVRIAADNDVALFPSAVITVSGSYTGADGAHPVNITSYEEDIEKAEAETVTSSGTPLVLYTEAAGGAEQAAAADAEKLFVPSAYMPNPNVDNAGKLLVIGQSKETDRANYLTYIGAASKITVTFDANGGSWNDADTQKSFQVPALGNLTLPNNPQNGGKTFGGWNTAADGSGTAYAPNQTIPAPSTDTTYYAQWKSNDEPGGGSTTDPDKPISPSDPNDSSKTDEGDDSHNASTTSPQTGDVGSTALWIAALLAALTGATVAIFALKKAKAR